MENCLTGYITVEQASKKVGYTPEGIRKAIRQRRLKAMRKGRRLWLIHKDDFERFRNGK